MTTAPPMIHMRVCMSIHILFPQRSDPPAIGVFRHADGFHLLNGQATPLPALMRPRSMFLECTGAIE
jgi:hypothetical protein